MVVYLPTPSLEGLEAFMIDIEELRSSFPRQKWQEFCRNDVRLEEWRHFLCDDPYTRHGLMKPRGYAGDAQLMDYAYGHPSIHRQLENATETGRRIYKVTHAAPQSQSARDRIIVVSNVLKNLQARSADVRVASFACGHAREIEELGSEIPRLSEFVAVDADRCSLAEVRASYGNRLNVSPLHRNVFRLRSKEIGQVDLAYAMGLFDYANEAAATRLIATMGETVTRGGSLLVGNLAEGAANLGYCEAVMDWWMIPRTKDQMEALARILRDQGWQAKVIRKGCFRYILATNLR